MGAESDRKSEFLEHPSQSSFSHIVSPAGNTLSTSSIAIRVPNGVCPLCDTSWTSVTKRYKWMEGARPHSWEMLEEAHEVNRHVWLLEFWDAVAEELLEAHGSEIAADLLRI